MRIFGSDRMDGMLQKLGLKEDEAIVHPWINKALERAQGKVEAHNFDIRKNLLKYDNVMNDQRKVIFEQRIELMSDEHVGETVRDMRHEVVDELVAKFIPERAYAEQWDVDGLAEAVKAQLNLDLPIAEWAKEEGIADEEIRERIDEGRRRADGAEGAALRPGADARGREAGAAADARPSVARASRDARPPALGDRLPRLRAARSAERIQDRGLRAVPDAARHPAARRDRPARACGDPAAPARAASAAAGRGAPHRSDDRRGRDGWTTRRSPPRRPQPRREPKRDATNPSTWGKVGRNEPCPCGSGKKYKQCHGMVVA